MTSELFRGHVEGEEVDAEEGLTVLEGGLGESVDFFDPGVSHREAAEGDIGPMNHDETAAAVVGFVEGIWIADVEGEVEVALWVHLVGLDEVEALGNLAVALALLVAQFS